MAMNPDPVECAIWITGTESDEHLRQWKADVVYLMSRSRGEPFMKLGPISFEVKRPGDDRVPQVPDHISGPDVRLLVATAEVLGFETAKRASFLDELSEADLVRLRAATRRQHGRRGQLTDAICDQIIEQMGPVTAAKGINGVSVH
jgi:hypothetical protein